MSNDVAPIVFISYSHDSPEHKDQVRAFSAFLRSRIGLDVRLDQWDDNVRRDWSLWATRLFRTANFVIVIASPEYRRRADGEAAAHEGRGAQFEAAMIRDALTKDLGAATERILPVVLPGGSVDDIPTFLNPHSTTRFTITEFTEEGTAELLAAITGIGKHPLPERGEWLGTGQPVQTHPADTSRWLANSPGVRPDTARIDGIYYPRSIVLRSAPDDAPAFVEIDLGGVYQWFTAVAGVLDDARELHQVARFRVSVDGKLLAQCNAAFGKPRDIDVPVLGGAKLRLEMHRPRGPIDVAWGDPTLS
ncbi:MAG TPA: SEFIR domain-containing protein [Pseudonocardiaceae bacterium]|jgi:hypothetical protein|nr:SEFIR domain-containing protein [Pseudonocardiaceae bacterium]